jgi:hypothetical protein
MNAKRLHYAVMTVVLTVRDVPEEVRDLLAREARERGQSLQAYLLSVLRRQADFSGNRQILAEIEAELAVGGGVGADAPDPATVLDQERAAREGIDRPADTGLGAPDAGAAPTGKPGEGRSSA